MVPNYRYHFINNATITHLSNLTKLSLRNHFICGESLKALPHLEKCSLHWDTVSYDIMLMSSLYGLNFEFIKDMKALKVIHLPHAYYFNCAAIQEIHSGVRFKWFINRPHFSGHYEGEFLVSIMDGRGIFKFLNGDKYFGQFFCGQFEGFGIFSSIDGGKYEGSFRNGKKNGQGKLCYPVHEGKKEYEGMFLDGKFHDFGKLILANGNHYEGNFRENIIFGDGTYYFRNGCGPYERKVNAINNTFLKGILYYEGTPSEVNDPPTDESIMESFFA